MLLLYLRKTMSLLEYAFQLYQLSWKPFVLQYQTVFFVGMIGLLMSFIVSQHNHFVQIVQSLRERHIQHLNLMELYVDNKYNDLELQLDMLKDNTLFEQAKHVKVLSHLRETVVIPSSQMIEYLRSQNIARKSDVEMCMAHIRSSETVQRDVMQQTKKEFVEHSFAFQRDMLQQVKNYVEAFVPAVQQEECVSSTTSQTGEGDASEAGSDTHNTNFVLGYYNGCFDTDTLGVDKYIWIPKDTTEFVIDSRKRPSSLDYLQPHSLDELRSIQDIVIVVSDVTHFYWNDQLERMLKLNRVQKVTIQVYLGTTSPSRSNHFGNYMELFLRMIVHFQEEPMTRQFFIIFQSEEPHGVLELRHYETVDKNFVLLQPLLNYCISQSIDFTVLREHRTSKTHKVLYENIFSNEEDIEVDEEEEEVEDDEGEEEEDDDDVVGNEVGEELIMRSKDVVADVLKELRDRRQQLVLLNAEIKSSSSSV